MVHFNSDNSYSESPILVQVFMSMACRLLFIAGKNAQLVMAHMLRNSVLQLRICSIMQCYCVLCICCSFHGNKQEAILSEQRLATVYQSSLFVSLYPHLIISFIFTLHPESVSQNCPGIQKHKMCALIDPFNASEIAKFFTLNITIFCFLLKAVPKELEIREF